MFDISTLWCQCHGSFIGPTLDTQNVSLSLQVNFKLNEVKIPDFPGMFTTFVVGNEKETPLFVDGVQAFSSPKHYIKLMGYDKPLDLR